MAWLLRPREREMLRDEAGDEAAPYHAGGVVHELPFGNWEDSLLYAGARAFTKRRIQAL